jgi:hypothetical protein
LRHLLLCQLLQALCACSAQGHLRLLQATQAGCQHTKQQQLPNCCYCSQQSGQAANRQSSGCCPTMNQHSDPSTQLCGQQVQ